METKRIGTHLIDANKGQIADLPCNPRKWTQQDVQRLQKSIEETPELLEARPLIVIPCEGRYVTLGGNMRLEACRNLGHSDVPCYVIPEKTSVDKLKEIVIKDNSSYGEWDEDLLKSDWNDVSLDAWGVVGLNGSIEGSEPLEKVEAVEDDFDENREKIESRCAPGDIWRCGRHRVMCGDSTRVEDVNSLIGGGLAQMLLTDPPYNVDYEGGTKDKLKIMNDSMSSDRFEAFLRDAFFAANEGLMPGAAIYIWMSTKEEETVIRVMRNLPWLFKQIIIWVKNHFVLGRQDYQWQHEPCIYGWKDGAAHYFVNDRTQATVVEDEQPDPRKMKKEELVAYVENIRKTKEATTIIRENAPMHNDLHPTMKPLKLFGRLVRNSTRPGDSVLDVFGGSGSTLMVCEQLDRKALVMELDPHYCDVILSRWEKFTGQKAEKIN